MTKKQQQLNKQHRKLEREKAKKKKQQTLIIMSSTIAVLLLVVLIISIVFQNSKKAETTSPGQTAGTGAPSTTQVIQYNNEPMMGKANAPVKIAEFGDYKCPICRNFEMQVFPKLKKDYIDTGKVQFYFMNYPIIAQDSTLAANASETIYEEHPGYFWKFHQLLYQNQGDENQTWVTQDLLVKIAKEAVPSLDVKPFEWSLSQSSYQDQVNRDKTMGERAGVDGTPTLFVNGTMASNALDYNSLKEEINQALKKAKK